MNLPTLSLAVLRLGLSPLALVLSSCVVNTDPGYGSYGSGYGSGGYVPYGSFGGGYRSAYSRSGYCNICRSYSCSGHHDSHGHYDDLDDHNHYGYRESDHRKSSGSDQKHREDAYRIAAGSTGNKVTPKGYHSPSWYESRGYDTSRLRLENEDGDRYRTSSGSSSSSKSSSSGSKSSGSGSSSSKSSGGGSKMNSDNPRLQQRSGSSGSSRSSGGSKDNDSRKRN